MLAGVAQGWRWGWAGAWLAQLSQRGGSIGVDQATGVEAFNVDERHADQADPYRPHTGGEGVADGVEDEARAVGGAEELDLILD